ncbi:MAG TPA: hypothetical protein DCE41_03395 [Cytophagales bacterium]|nr:hypothetical protein [Cytophagales bacterium]
MLMKYVKAGKLRLDEPIKTYIPESELPDEIQVCHILSHTSEGLPGSFFNYSPRYGLLTPVLEQVSGMPYEELLQQEILDPLSLTHTVSLTNQQVIDSLAGQWAQPYYYGGEAEPGHFDVGVSTSSGLSSTVQDLSRFAQTLLSGEFLTPSSFQQMATPFATTRGASPYGLGIFTQQFLGKQLVWGFGQEDCYSSLVLMLPQEGLTLTLLANNNLMSDPPRLINGDVTYSLFALSFLKHYVFDLPTLLAFSDWQDPNQLAVEVTSPDLRDFYRQEYLAHALAASFMGRGDVQEMARSRQLTQQALELFPDLTSYGNLSTLRLLSVLAPAHPNEFGGPLEQLGASLLQENPQNPYANIYLAFYYQSQNQPDKAHDYFLTVAEATNFHPFWYTIQSLDFLGQYYQEQDPAQAQIYYQRVVDIGFNMGGAVDRATDALEEMNR